MRCRLIRPRIELLVDGDTHRADEIDWAVRRLKSGAKQVKATVFANPDRLRNQKWHRFVQEPGLHFHGVQRSAGYTDPNDAAIMNNMRLLACIPDVQQMFLLTSDADFVHITRELCDAGTEVAVLIPEDKRLVISKYEQVGIRVIPIPNSGTVAYTVRAWLHADGTGDVSRCKPIQKYHVDNEAQLVRSFLGQMVDFSESDFHLVAVAAKCWIANSLGTLTVFPHQCAIEELHGEIVRGNVKSSQSILSLAFVFPLSP